MIRGREQMGSSLLHIQALSAWYDGERKVLSDLSMELWEHEVVGLIGLNGAGKTTFIKVLSGLLDSFSTERAVFHGRSVGFRDSAFKMDRYTVFAEDASFQYFTFREYLAYAAAAYRRKDLDRGVVDALVRGFHFEDHTDVLLKDLSTGNRKKVFLITAFAVRPGLLLLDEPVNGLDFQSTEFLYQQIAGYRAYGTVLFSSHILESITITCDRVHVLEEGSIRQTFEGDQINAAKIREVLRYEKDV